jgi:hypothetical protein
MPGAEKGRVRLLLCLYSDMPGGTVGFREQAIGLIVADESLGGRIPAELAFEQHGDVADVADGRGTVADLGGGGGRAAGLDGVDEVAVVIDAGAEPDVVGAEGCRLQVFRPTGKAPIPRLDPAAVAFKANLHIFGAGLADQLDTVDIQDAEMNLRRSRE